MSEVNNLIEEWSSINTWSITYKRIYHESRKKQNIVVVVIEISANHTLRPYMNLIAYNIHKTPAINERPHSWSFSQKKLWTYTKCNGIQSCQETPNPQVESLIGRDQAHMKEEPWYRVGGTSPGRQYIWAGQQSRPTAPRTRLTGKRWNLHRLWWSISQFFVSIGR